MPAAVQARTRPLIAADGIRKEFGMGNMVALGDININM